MRYSSYAYLLSLHLFMLNKAQMSAVLQESEIHTGSKTNILTRTVTLQMLLDGKILQPAEGAMTIEYLVSHSIL